MTVMHNGLHLKQNYLWMKNHFGITELIKGQHGLTVSFTQKPDEQCHHYNEDQHAQWDDVAH